jgi:nickel/cobalt transporter (NicO) family protein
MITLLVGSALLSIFHALIPSHWLPVLAIGRKQGWSGGKVLWVTVIAGSAHVVSTILLGSVFAAFGGALADRAETFTHWITPAMLIVWGGYYIWAHYFHHHFHLHEQKNGYGVIGSLVLAMFFSPCLEIEGYFLAAGPYGWGFVSLLALVYGLLSVSGMIVWVWLAQHGLHRLNWHAWEHNAGIITGLTLVLSGILSFVFH